MNNNDFWIRLCFLIIISMQFFIVYEIKKHSVHPVHGKYEQKTLGCAPWDSCKPDDKCENER